LCGQNKCIIKCYFKKVTKEFPSGVHLRHYTLQTIWSFCNWGCCFQSRRRDSTLWRELCHKQAWMMLLCLFPFWNQEWKFKIIQLFAFGL